MKTAKRRKPIKASTLTRHAFEKRGWVVGFCERYIELKIPGAAFPIKKRFDLFGIFDHVAFRPDNPDVAGLQSCGISDWAEHLTKILNSEPARQWVSFPNRRIALVGWARNEVRGGKNRMKFKWIRASDFDLARPEQPGAGGGTSPAGASPPPAGPAAEVTYSETYKALVGE